MRPLITRQHERIHVRVKKRFMKTRKVSLIAVLLLLFVVVNPVAAAPQDVGIVLLHGKWAAPPTPVAYLARVLLSKGFKVVTPDMPWSKFREYDVDYPAALSEIDAAAKSLRDAGVKRIVVAGHSFGANAALAYAGSGRDIDAVIAIAPGHTPDQGRFRAAVAASVEKARKLIAGGKGDEISYFEDRNQGRTKSVRTTPKNYLSYFDPEGLGAMPKSAATIRKPTPFFWIVENQSPLVEAGEDYAFNRAPKHPNSKYLVLTSDHLDAPSTASSQIVEWLLSLGF
jgi:pimeloyl-ACP methyl ester carboxylesterase